ncbi:MAG: hypothetical protein J0H15_07010 [Xanthomonadales bacterium]|nr:hypothetical protein [Xanthomonadales bacterium]
MRTLSKLHPDWRDIDESESFKSWLGSASAETQALARSSNPYDVAKVLTTYKADMKLSALFQPK